jgi:uncharacterized protein (DUF2384 family)
MPLTAEQEIAPTPIADEDAAAMFRACMSLFRLWRVSDAEADVLLDLPPRTLARWKSGAIGPIERDQRVRLAQLLDIHKALRTMFHEPNQAYSWVRQRNRAFGDRSALDVMLGGELSDLTRVRRHVFSETGL